CMQDIEFPLTF
nr:immunoglobulin light chain junction region [Macaca mulatta]